MSQKCRFMDRRFKRNYDLLSVLQEVVHWIIKELWLYVRIVDVINSYRDNHQRQNKKHQPSEIFTSLLLRRIVPGFSRIKGRRLVLSADTSCCGGLGCVFSAIFIGVGVTTPGITRFVACSTVCLNSSSSSMTIGVSFPPLTWTAGAGFFL